MARDISGKYDRAKGTIEIYLICSDRHERVGYTYSCTSNCLGNRASSPTSTSLVRAGSRIGTMT